MGAFMTDDKMLGRVLELPREIKRLLALAVDILLCAGSVTVAFYLRLGLWPAIDQNLITPIEVSIALALPSFIMLGLYRAIFRYAGWSALMTILRAVLLYSIPFSTIYTFIGVPGVPRTVGLIQPILLFLLVAGSRTAARLTFGRAYRSLWRRDGLPHVLIYGAGSAGRQLANAIRASNEMRVVGFIDDDPKLRRATIDNIMVHGPQDLESVVARRSVTDILLAIPSASRTRRGEIVHRMRHLNLHVRTLPGLIDMARGNISVSDLRELDIEDLLGRSPVPPDLNLIERNLTGRTILVTGAGGSIGSELCRQIVRQRPAVLLLVEVSEFNLYTIHEELAGSGAYPACAIVPLLASVADTRRMTEIFSVWRPDLVFHAAAYKHVPLVEHNVIEGIRNNSFGTYTVAKLANEFSASDFVLISTDKAVRPTNIMGASKRLAELTLQAMHDQGGSTCYSMVRFGNVLGSSGSVVPLFRRQVASGGPVTITDPEITRYFMTIPEAAQLVLHAGAMARGGDVFVLDMGEPVKIIDLARNIIELSGLTVRDASHPDGDIEIRTIGLRPGEKLYEELLIGNDPAPTSHPRILRAHEKFMPWSRLSVMLDNLQAALNDGDARLAQRLLREAVPEYVPNSALVDWVANGQAEAIQRVAAE